MELDWSTRTVGSWRELMAQAPRANWMQTWPYAKATRQRDQKNTRLAVIRDQGAPVGLMALQEIKLGPIHLLNLQRGPLWFSEEPGPTQLNEFSELFRDTFPKNIFRRRRWMPEWEISDSAQNILVESGFQILPQTYQTIWLDLQNSEDQLRARLKQKWRNGLNKGLRANLEIISNWQGQGLDLFLKNYESHKKKKKYPGPSSLFVKEEFLAALPFGDSLLLWARKNKEPIAGIMVMLHGSTASYRVGWNTLLGRTHNAHYVLLWQAIQILKSRGIKAFDLGGIKPGEADGLTHFKQGMGGRESQLLGMFR